MGEKVVCKNCSGLTAEGREFQHCNNLTELIMDDSSFKSDSTHFPFLSRISNLSDLAGHDDDFVFGRCTSVERLSIRNACLYGKRLPQNALIKFVRNAPSSLRWFRSDLTKQNIHVLQKGRPGIEFLN